MLPSVDRQIRVFVSSTFRDMKAEREELAKRVFPILRKRCEARGVVWGDVDLRWGITAEAAAEGQVLPICLEEIRGCRPYFIGVLGERYGWVPRSIPDRLLDAQPWLAEHRERSVTELEILHGVLNDPAMADHAFFYFRDPAYIDHLPAGVVREDARPESAEAAAKLSALKQRIRLSGLPLREGYADPKAFGELVLADLGAVIDQLFPESSQPDALEREASEHEAFARSRAVVEVRAGEAVGVYIGRQDYVEQLDAHAAGGGPPLVVLGESGSGKSALLANWALSYRGRHPEVLLLLHFIGATPASADWMAMLRRILGELNRKLGLGAEIPDTSDALRATFANALHMAAARGRVILILDALNQLEDRDQAPDLVWLPPVIPEGVRLIVSTLPGRPLDDLTRRGWPVLTVQPLAAGERRELIEKYLRQYRKQLSEVQAERVAAAPQTANPLYLRTLLEELRLWGVHETLDQCITGYLSAATVDELYERMLARYEGDYEGDRPGLVRDATTLLWAARRGLSEAELLDLLGHDGTPLPRAHWSPLYLAAETSLVNRSGLIGFFHDYLRQAVESRYLPTDEDRRRAHLRLADYFGRQELGVRKIDELPWQLAQAEAWRPLCELLADVAVFNVAYQVNEFEVKAYWARIEACSPLRLVEAYAPVLAEPQAYGRDAVYRLSLLVADTGHPDEAFALGSWLVEHFLAIGDGASLQGCLGNQALILKARGDLDGAMALMKEQERLCRELGNKDGLSTTLDNQALILRARGDLDGAMALHQEGERLCRALGDKVGLSASLGNQANTVKTRGDLDRAMTLYQEVERLCRELGHSDGLSASLGNQANICFARGDLDGATALHQEEERLCRALGNKAGLSASLGNQALILNVRGDLDGAMALHQEEERLCRALGNKAGLSASLGNQALILQARGDLDGAMALHQEKERLCRELESKEGLSTALGNQALILRDRGDLDGAMALMKEQERLCRELESKEGLQASLGNQALIFRDRGDLDEAIVLLKEQERLCRALGNKTGLSASLGNQAVILKAHGDLDGAMALHQEEERLCRALGNKGGLSASLGNQAQIRRDRGDLDGAMALLKEQERLCRDLESKEGLQASLGNQALLLQARGDLDGAMALHQEKERLCRELGNKDGLQRTLGNQALILKARGDLDGAMALHQERERLCRELGNKDGLQRTLGNQALILKARGDLDGAMALHQEEERLCRELASKEGLSTSLGNQALILKARGDLDGALARLEEVERLCRDLGNKDGLSASLRDQALVLQARGDSDGAMALHQERERLCRELGHAQGLASSLASQAHLLAFAKHRPQDALPLAEEALRIASHHGLAPLVRSIEAMLNELRRQ